MEAYVENSVDELRPEELKRRLLGLSTLVEITRDLAVEIDLDAILTMIAVEACRALDCERASLFQYDPRRQELYTRITTELEINEIRGSIDQGITGYVARNREIANISTPADDPRWNSSVDEMTGFRTRNILAVPITSPHGDRLLGVLELINKRGRSFDWFDQELLLAFGQHAAVALDRARLVEELRQRDTTEVSLKVAREIQRGFMPSRLPGIPGYQVGTWWFPNEAVGGDYCDVVPLRDGRMSLIIADVSGHGLGPALIMASVRAGLRALMLDHSSADMLLSKLGRSMSDDLRDGRFITMVFAALDWQRHRLEYANAGHAPAMHYHAASRTFSPLDATGLPLGVLEHPSYEAVPPRAIEVGDLVVFCTDGIIEAMDEHCEQFGMRRLQQIIVEYAHVPVVQLVREIGTHVESHYLGDNPPDDLTVLAVRRES